MLHVHQHRVVQGDLLEAGGISGERGGLSSSFLVMPSLGESGCVDVLRDEEKIEVDISLGLAAPGVSP